MVNWLLLVRTLDQIGFYFSSTIQLTVIILTLFFVKREFGSYKVLIVSFSVIGVIFGCFDFLICPVVHSYNDGFILFSSTQFPSIPVFIQSLFLVSYCTLFAVTLCIIAIQYIYRYISVFHEYRLHYFRGPKWIFWILYTVWFGFQFGSGYVIFASFDDVIREKMGGVMWDFYEMNISETAGFSVVAYESTNNETSTRWWNLGFVFNISAIMGLQYAIMIYCGYKLYHDMEEKIQMLSKQMKQLHWQIFKTLMLQITLPTIFLFSPVAFTIFAPILDLKMNIPTGMIISGYAIYPALDGLFLIYCIDDYWKALIGLLFCANPNQVVAQSMLPTVT